MSDNVLIVEDGKAKLIKRKKYSDESTLQSLLEQYPELISLQDIQDDPLPLVPIGLETSVPSGSIDLLFCDASGVTTLVETKLAKNPQVRREVVGQIIEYAAFLHDIDASDLEEIAEKYLSKKTRKYESKARTFKEHYLDHVMSDNTDDADVAFESFKSNAIRYLRDGRIRLVIVVDEIVDSLRTTVSFLNLHSTFEIVVLQLKRFSTEDKRDMFVPTLFGFAPPKPPADIDNLTPETFHQQSEPHAWELYKQLKKISGNDRRIEWHRQSFGYPMWHKGKKFVPFIVWTTSLSFFTAQLRPENGVSAADRDRILAQARLVPGLEKKIDEMKEPGLNLRKDSVSKDTINKFVELVEMYQSIVED